MTNQDRRDERRRQMQALVAAHARPMVVPDEAQQALVAAADALRTALERLGPWLDRQPQTPDTQRLRLAMRRWDGTVYQIDQHVRGGAETR